MARLPGPEDVQRVPIARDPGVSTPDLPGGLGLDVVGGVLGGISETLRVEVEKQQGLVDGAALSDSVLAFDAEATDLYTRTLVEKDLGDMDALVKYRKDVDDLNTRIIGGIPPSVSDETRQLIETRLAVAAQKRRQNGDTEHLRLLKLKAIDSTTALTNSLALQALEDPYQLPDLLDEVGDTVGRIRDSLTPDVEASLLAGERAAVITAAVDGYIKQRDYTGAIDNIINNPDYTADIDAKGRAGFLDKILRKQTTELRSDISETNKAVEDAAFVLGNGETPEGLEDLQKRIVDLNMRARETGDEKLMRAAVSISEILNEGLKNREVLAEFAGLTPAEQNAKINELVGLKEMTANQVFVREQYGKILVHQVKEIDAGRGLSLWISLIEDEPLVEWDLHDPSTITDRYEQAALASAHFGMQIAAFLPEEAASLEKIFTEGSPTEVVAVLEVFRKALPDDQDLSSLAPILASLNPGLAMVLHSDNPSLIRDYVDGVRLLETSPELKMSMDKVVTPALEAWDTKGLFVGASEMYAPLREAVIALTAYRMIGKDDMEEAVVIGEFDKALKIILGGVEDREGKVDGGPIMFREQAIVPPDPLISSDELNHMMLNLTDNDFIEFGNFAPPRLGEEDTQITTLFDVFGDEIELDTVREEGVLVMVAPGEYQIRFPEIGMVLGDVPGGVFEIDLGALFRARVKAGFSGVAGEEPSRQFSRPSGGRYGHLGPQE
jgi:hypothetical protein